MAGTLRIEQFGGMNRRHLPRGLSPQDCVDTLNLLTRHGGLDVREPVSVFMPHTAWADSATPGNTRVIVTGREMRSATLASPVMNEYLHLIWQYGGTLYDTILNHEGTISQVLSIGALDLADTDRAMIQARDIMYLVHTNNSKDQYKVYVSVPTPITWAVAKLGIVPPAAPSCSAVDVGTGNFPAGTVVSHRITYANSVTGTESPPSEARTTTSGSDFNVKIDWSASSDSQVDKVRIYRMIEGTDDTWYFAIEVDHSLLTYTDTNWSISKDFDSAINLAGQRPPHSRTACWHKRRMWYAPYDTPGEVVHSELFRPENVNNVNSYSVGGPDGQLVRVMCSLGGYLFVLRFRSIWAIAGDGPDTFASSEIDPKVGCVAPRSFVLVGNRAAFFAGVDGFYRLGPEGTQPIGQPLGDSWWRNNARSYWENISGVHDEKHRMIIWCGVGWPLTGAPQPWGYDYKRDRWVRFSIPDILTMVGWLDRKEGEMLRPYFFKNNGNGYEGDMLRMRAETDWRDYGTTAIPWHWESGDLDLRTLRPKRIRNIVAGWQKGAAADTISVKHRVNRTGSFTGRDFKLNDDPPVGQDPIGRQVDTVAFRLEGSATKETRIGPVEIDGEPVGGRP